MANVREQVVQTVMEGLAQQEISAACGERLLKAAGFRPGVAGNVARYVREHGDQVADMTACVLTFMRDDGLLESDG